MCMKHTKQGSTYSLYLHDIAYLYAMVIDDARKQGASLRDGAFLYSQAITKNFTGKTSLIFTTVLYNIRTLTGVQ